MRLFVAVAPPAAVLDELEAASAPFRAGRPELRWTSRDAWHITLAFLGEVDGLTTGRLIPRLERAASGHGPFSLAFAGAGAFPAASRARVLWSGLSGDRGSLAALAESVAAGARRAGATPPDEGRPFRPHLTLARCRMPADVRDITTAIGDYAGAPWTADRIHLIHSRPDGQPRYDTIGSWPLSGAVSRA
jgi:RNA 2',3'-cyclic 3'-phosphodiesterase